MSPDIVIIGHVINETIQFPDRTIAPVLGSPAAYSSVIAGVLGAQVGLVTKIGADMPEQLLDPFCEASVDMNGVSIKGQHSTANLLVYDELGNKRVEYLEKAPDIFFDDIPQHYESASLLFVCPMDYEVPLSTIRGLRDLSGEIVVDLGGFGGATSARHPDQRPPTELRKLADLVDVVKGSIEDCRHLFGHDVAEAEIARVFVEWGAQVGMVTLGHHGALAVTEEEEHWIPSFPSKTVDVTGAGDAYSAGFLVEYLETGDIERAARFGCATASLVIEATGGVLVERMPTVGEIHARLQAAEPEKVRRPSQAEESRQGIHTTQNEPGNKTDAVGTTIDAQLPCPSRPLPPPLKVSEEGSFAHYTLVERLPAIVQRVITENGFSTTITERLQTLRDELLNGSVRLLEDDSGPDLAAWAGYVEPYLGQRWLELPWYFAEAYFYRRLLEATRYFSPGRWQGVDPFETQKHAGLEVATQSVRALSKRLNRLLSNGGSIDQSSVATLIHFGLWGNRADLSLQPKDNEGHEASRVDVADERANILVDDTAILVDRIISLEGERVDFIMDNAGFELFCDLCLADFLLTSGVAGTVCMHLKAHPTFVSDATVDDVQHILKVLADDGNPEVLELAGRLRSHFAETRRLRLRDHLFWNAPLAFWDTPDDVHEDLKGAALVFVKGDANYRRLLGDRQWSFNIPLGGIVGYFPSPLAVLRTLKSELVVGLQQGQPESLRQRDPNWLINGSWGLIQVVDPLKPE